VHTTLIGPFHFLYVPRSSSYCSYSCSAHRVRRPGGPFGGAGASGPVFAGGGAAGAQGTGPVAPHSTSSPGPLAFRITIRVQLNYVGSRPHAAPPLDVLEAPLAAAANPARDQHPGRPSKCNQRRRRSSRPRPAPPPPLRPCRPAKPAPIGRGDLGFLKPCRTWVELVKQHLAGGASLPKVWRFESSPSAPQNQSNVLS